MNSKEKENRAIYTGLYRNNKTNLKISLGLCYIGVGTEIFKILYHKKIVTTLVSTMGCSFFLGTLYFYHKITPNQLIKFVPTKDEEESQVKTETTITSDDESDQSDDESDDEEIEITEEEDHNLSLPNKRPTFNYLRYYKSLGYGALGGVIGNLIATAGLAITYDLDVATEWNRDFYLEIFSYISGTTLHNAVVFLLLDSAMKTKFFMFEKKKILNNLK
ncbi:hypothetical protein DICPUDRAFT_82738 [Dictyostelium purpureum]|uniref:Uncharacterized protein n=1 Tax=Dictyostelium purpureum TaxID=5786 RepID=F0ZXF4_DICPU|nr:uncharacterized protein DICPUDRAFT_82738 [Dictyostelium purpureum]EGC31375.1 hypothetical protein DICPUDRAFT_82738 [Dictyostelium purpureum]|eukprot:XP_003292096.1 hypothetical protein DICPUDRAFT_82738 [Dictyostelium purpureum]